MKPVTGLILFLLMSINASAAGEFFFSGSWVWADANRNAQQRGNESTLEFDANNPNAKYCYNQKCYNVIFTGNNEYITFRWQNRMFEFHSNEAALTLFGKFHESGRITKFPTATISMRLVQ